jgi:hypothetical protein
VTGAESAVGVGEVLAAIAIVQQGAQTAGGLVWQTDEITYPKSTASASGTESLDYQAAHFYAPGNFTDCDTYFVAKGDFSVDPPILANVRIMLSTTTTYSSSSLSFTAKALDTAFGTPQDPRVRFECTGRFDPAGPGDASYDVVLEVNRSGEVHVISAQLTNGGGHLIDQSPSGFKLDMTGETAHGMWVTTSPPSASPSASASPSPSAYASAPSSAPSSSPSPG